MTAWRRTVCLGCQAYSQWFSARSLSATRWMTASFGYLLLHWGGLSFAETVESFKVVPRLFTSHPHSYNNDLQMTLWVTQRYFYSSQTFRRSTPSSVRWYCCGIWTGVNLCKSFESFVRGLETGKTAHNAANLRLLWKLSSSLPSSNFCSNFALPKVLKFVLSIFNEIRFRCGEVVI